MGSLYRTVEEKSFCAYHALVMYIDDDSDRGLLVPLSAQSAFGLSFVVSPYRLPRSIVVAGGGLLLLIKQLT